MDIEVLFALLFLSLASDAAVDVCKFCVELCAFAPLGLYGGVELLSHVIALSDLIEKPLDCFLK